MANPWDLLTERTMEFLFVHFYAIVLKPKRSIEWIQITILEEQKISVGILQRTLECFL